MEMLHQDLRPENIMIDKTGTVKIIDFRFGAGRGHRGVRPVGNEPILGTAQYTAPEYFLGEGGTPRSDIFSLGVITYQMLTGRLPYGARMAQARTKSRAGQDSPALRCSTTIARFRPGSTGRCARRFIPSRRGATTSCSSSSTTCAIPTADCWIPIRRRCWSAIRCCSGKACRSRSTALILLMLAFQYGRFR